jgi:DNA-binding FadR family transcriptional regulator
MPLRAVPPQQRLYRTIARQIERLLDRGEFGPGARLPAERELAARLGVSRPSVREALIALEIAGRVEVKVGSGIYVRDPPAPAAALDDAEVGPFDALAARSLIEGETAALAARRATAAELGRIAEAFELLVADATADPPRSRGDGLFHIAIAEASGNAAYALLVKTLWAQRRGPVSRRLDELLVSAARRRQNIAEHRAILEAIRRRDPAAARVAMRRHLGNIARVRLAAPRAPRVRTGRRGTVPGPRTVSRPRSSRRRAAR